MKIIDCHVHVGDSDVAKKTLENSIYRNKYRLYSSIDYQVMDEVHNFLDVVEGYFAIPIIFKESSIEDSNLYLREYCKHHPKALAVPLINGDLCYSDLKSLIYKEHFLLHNYKDFSSREEIYTYLNERSGYLLLHCKDEVRIEYIKRILECFPNIKIIIAHLGRNVFADYSFSKRVIDEFYNYNNVFFDTSTITNESILMYGIFKCGADKILFGSDFPYEKKTGSTIEEYYGSILNLKIPMGDKEKILYENAARVRRYCKKRK